MTGDRASVAAALAAAYLDGDWTTTGLAARGRLTIGVSARRLTEVSAAVLSAYRDPPIDRRRELAGFLSSLDSFDALWGRRPHPVVKRLPLPVAAMGAMRWPVPALDGVSELALWAGLDVEHLDWYADVRSLERMSAGNLLHYDRKWVYSRRGGVRLLESPRDRLKALQRKVFREILALVPVHDAAHGFVRGRSVMTYAAPHAGRDLIVHLDLSGFFASINAGRVFGVFRTAGYPEAVAHVLTGLTTTVLPHSVARTAPPALRDEDIDGRRKLLRLLSTPHLPQGAPTSPAIANLVGYRLDCRLARLAESLDVAYTRYADDLAFSLGGPDAARRGRRLVDVVRRVVRDEGFRVNEAKTRAVPQSRQQKLCGVVVNQAPGVARADRNQLRAVLENCRRNGPASQNRDGHADFQAHLKGRIAWVAAVNPQQGSRLRRQFDSIEW